MSKKTLQTLIYIFITIIIVILSIKFIIWLSPIIIIGILSYYIYKQFKKNKKKNINKQPNKKPIKIIDMVEDDK